MRFLAGAAALFGSVAAQASFELLLVADSGNDRIHRFDPQSQTYLGSFGGDILQNPVGLAVNQATNECAVFCSSQVEMFIFNYNTGELKRSFSTGVSTVNPRLAIGASGNIQVAYFSVARAFEPITGALIQNWSSGSQYGAIGYDSAANLTYIVDYATDTISAFSLNTAPPVFTTPPTAGLLGEGDMAFFNGSAFFTDSSTTVRVWNRTSTSTAATFAVVPGFSAVNSIARGHGSFYAGGTLGGGGSGIVRISNLGTVGSSWGSGQLSDPRQMAIVVAPEPGVMAGFGVGLVGVLLKGRKGAASR